MTKYKMIRVANPMIVTHRRVEVNKISELLTLEALGSRRPPARDGAGQEDGGRQQGCRCGDSGANEAKAHQEEGDDRRREDLEETFDP
jgi:hypothetical protein